jgi:hypothetical protein
VAEFASEENAFLPAHGVLSRAQKLFPNLVHARCLMGCRHGPSGAAPGGVNDDIGAFLAGSEGTSELSFAAAPAPKTCERARRLRLSRQVLGPGAPTHPSRLNCEA